MELRQYASIFLKWLWLIALGGVLAGGSAYVGSKLTLPTYQSTTTPSISAFMSLIALFAAGLAPRTM